MVLFRALMALSNPTPGCIPRLIPSSFRFLIRVLGITPLQMAAGARLVCMGGRTSPRCGFLPPQRWSCVFLPRGVLRIGSMWVLGMSLDTAPTARRVVCCPARIIVQFHRCPGGDMEAAWHCWWGLLPSALVVGVDVHEAAVGGSLQSGFWCGV